jgi:hypothetical protein
LRAVLTFISAEWGGDCGKNKDLSRKFTSPKWEVKNTYLVMPARRVSGGFIRRYFGGLA